MSLFKSHGKKSQAEAAFQRALEQPEDSIARTNLLLEGMLIMQFEINRHSAWTDFNTTANVLSRR